MAGNLSPKNKFLINSLTAIQGKIVESRVQHRFLLMGVLFAISGSLIVGGANSYIQEFYEPVDQMFWFSLEMVIGMIFFLIIGKIVWDEEKYNKDSIENIDQAIDHIRRE